MSSLTVRRLDVDLSRGFGRHWLGGDAYRTQFFNALSMTFPIGEQMFIDSLRAIPSERLADPALRAEVKDFIGQEATHRHMHVQYNAELERQGLSFVTGGHMAGPMLQYCLPRFHPWQHDNRALVQMWLDRNSEAYRAILSSAP